MLEPMLPGRGERRRLGAQQGAQPTRLRLGPVTSSPLVASTRLNPRVVLILAVFVAAVAFGVATVVADEASGAWLFGLGVVVGAWAGFT